MAMQVELEVSFNRMDFASAAAISRINPIVQPVLKAVDPMLLVPLAKSGEKEFAHIGLPIAIGVLGIKNVGCRADQHASGPRQYPIRKPQSLKKDCGLVIATITVGVLQDAHLTTRFAFTIHSQRVIPHFHYPQLPICAPVKSDGIGNQWFAGHQFNFEARWQAKGGEGFLNCFRGRLITKLEFTKADTQDLIGERGGILILNPKRIGAEPASIVRIRSATDNHWNLT